MDQENKNIVETEEETDKAMQSFLTGSNDYEEEKTEPAKGASFSKKDLLIAALAVFAIGIFTISNYGACVIAAIAIGLAIFTDAGKDAVHTVAANSFALGVCVVLKVTVGVVQTVFSLIFAFANATTSTLSNFSAFITIINYAIGILSFVFFIISLFALMSKKRTAVFNKTAAKLSDKED